MKNQQEIRIEAAIGGRNSSRVSRRSNKVGNRFWSRFINNTKTKTAQMILNNQFLTPWSHKRNSPCTHKYSEALPLEWRSSKDENKATECRKCLPLCGLPGNKQNHELESDQVWDLCSESFCVGVRRNEARVSFVCPCQVSDLVVHACLVCKLAIYNDLWAQVSKWMPMNLCPLCRMSREWHTFKWFISNFIFLIF